MRVAEWMRGRRRASAVPELNPGSTSSKPRLNRDVIVLGVIAFFVMVGFGVVVPVLPVYVQSFGVGNLEVGAVVSAFALMRFVFSPVCGRLIDWAGERAVLAIGIGIVALSSGLVGAADSYLQLLLLRGAGGIGSAMFSVSAMTLLLRTAEPGRRARAIGFYQGGFLIGGMAGPAIGSLLATISLTAPFFFYAGTLTVAGLVGLFLLRSGGRSGALAGGDASAVRTPFRTVLRDERFRAACIANFAQGWTSLGVRTTLIPLFVVVVLGGTSSWTGIALAAAAVAQALALAPAARFVDTVGRRPAIIGAFTVAGLAIVAISFSPNIWVLGALLCVYGVAAAFMGTAPAAAVGDAAGAHGGRPVSVFSMCADAGAIVGPLVAGLLVDTFSFSAGFAVGGIFLVIAAIYAVRMPAERRL
ncbi:MFS transporter [Cryobacterium sp. Hb1]|uniref:MFS transporter n=1 Tax=Cryobacterium sp. Hb1 TaxID=1259147 RepID=UPI001F542AB9|nr:MFS transporter [Cryobacterium sp. Hb1]